MYTVRDSKIPAVLTENLFINVAAGRAKLKIWGVIDALVAGHAADSQILGAQTEGGRGDCGQGDCGCIW
ncbi:hypothetical protein [Paenibacillus lautus]|uniref:hypothetical protein n=1 Tax=Paenibacillus lautus TaxID=1401 RepID=UPI002DBA5A35|nr:hypothetical protein [Paenibacillus lautus]MEC0257718.1 hypothetical protein [Paenibacillus lautus]